METDVRFTWVMNWPKEAQDAVYKRILETLQKEYPPFDPLTETEQGDVPNE